MVKAGMKAGIRAVAITVIALAAPLVACSDTGTSSSSADPSTVTITETTVTTVATAAAAPSGEAGGSSLSGNMHQAALPKRLLSAPVPSLCGQAAGTLTDGYLGNPQPHLGGTWVGQNYAAGIGDSDSVKFMKADLLGDGTQDIVVEVTCNQGGVGWTSV